MASDFRTRTLRAALGGFDIFTRMFRLSRWTCGQGIIFTLHHVLPDGDAAFAPNRLLAISPEFLDRAITVTRAAGFTFVTLDEAVRRLDAGEKGPPFAALTFDDAYRDVRDHALPVLRKTGVPATIFAVSSFADGSGFLWWRALEFAIAHSDVVDADLGEGVERIPARDAVEKNAAWAKIYWALRRGPEERLRAVVAELAERAGYDAESDCRAACMNLPELREIAADPLISIGAHTVSHYMLGKWPEQTVREEMTRNRADIERELGLIPAHIAYPVGDPASAGEREFAIARELGFSAGVTTRPDHVRARHAGRMLGLPRVSLNGLYQEERFLRPLLTGAPFAVRNMLKGG